MAGPHKSQTCMAGRSLDISWNGRFLSEHLPTCYINDAVYLVRKFETCSTKKLKSTPNCIELHS